MPPVELIEKRQENSKTFKLGNGRRQLVASIGNVHYKDNYADKSEQWKDIDLTWEGNKITKAPYELTVDGLKLTIRNKKTGEVSTIELIDIGGKALPKAPKAGEKEGNVLKIKDIALDTDLEIIPEFSAVRFRRILKSDKAPLEAKFKVTGNFIVSAGDEEDELPVETTLVDGILTETLKPDRLVKYPVKIDPTWQVGASNDDCHRVLQVTPVFNVSYAYQIAGNNDATRYEYGGGMRFTNITVPQGTTIDSAYLTFRSADNQSFTPCNTKISAEDVDNAGDFSGDDGSSFDTRFSNRTTARVSWIVPSWTLDGDYDSAEIKTVIQEIVDRGSWASGQALVIFWEDFGNESTANRYRLAYSYDGSTTYAPKLVIEYVAVIDYPISLSLGLTAGVTIDREVAWDRGTNPGLTLAVTIVKGWGRAIATSVDLAVSTSIDREVAYARAISAGLTASVSIVKGWGRTIATTANLIVSATIVKAEGWLITTTANLTVSTTISRELAYARATIADLTASVAVLKSWGRAIVITSNLTASTIVDRTVAYARAITIDITASASVDRLVNYIRATNSALGLSVSIVATLVTVVHYFISTITNLSISASVVKAVTYKRATAVNLVISVSIKYCAWLTTLIRVSISRLDIKRIPLYRRIRSCFP